MFRCDYVVRLVERSNAIFTSWSVCHVYDLVFLFRVKREFCSNRRTRGIIYEFLSSSQWNLFHMYCYRHAIRIASVKRQRLACARAKKINKANNSSVRSIYQSFGWISICREAARRLHGKRLISLAIKPYDTVWNMYLWLYCTAW